MSKNAPRYDLESCPPKLRARLQAAMDAEDRQRTAVNDPPPAAAPITQPKPPTPEIGQKASPRHGTERFVYPKAQIPELENIEARVFVPDYGEGRGPKLNETELRFLRRLESESQWVWIGVQCWRFVLGADSQYTPDFVTVHWDGSVHVWDSKGAFVREASKVRIKVAARANPMFKFWIARWQKKEWHLDKVTP